MIGIVSDGPTRPAFRWASPLPSWRSCSHTPRGMSRASRCTTSRWTLSSQFSWTMIAAVAPWAYTVAIPVRTPAAATTARTSAVMS